MKNILLSVFLGFAPAIAFACDLTGLIGVGVAINPDIKIIEATSGTHFQITSSNTLFFDNIPEGCHEMLKANCNAFEVFEVDIAREIAAAFICQATDPDGDIFLASGTSNTLANNTSQIVNTAEVSIIAGTGKWAALTGAKVKATAIGGSEDLVIYTFEVLN